MTKQEELTYLFGILSEASKWSPPPDDSRDFVRIEVEERIRNLIDGDVQEPDNLPAEEEDLTGSEDIAYPENAENARSKWERNKVRVFIDGKHVWKPRAECVKQPRDNSKGGPKWTWKWISQQDKKEQEDVNKLSDGLWAEHEAGNAYL